MYRFILVITAIVFLFSSCGPKLPQIEVDINKNVIVYTASTKVDMHSPIEHIYPKELQVIVEDYRHIQGEDCYKRAFTSYLDVRNLSKRGGRQYSLDGVPFPYHGYIMAHSSADLQFIDRILLKGHLPSEAEWPYLLNEMNTAFSDLEDGSLGYELMVLISCYLGDPSVSVLFGTTYYQFLAKFVKHEGIIFAPAHQTRWTAAWSGRTPYVYAKKLIEIINSYRYDNATFRNLADDIDRRYIEHKSPHFRVYKRVEGQNVVSECIYSKISDYYHEIGD